MWWLWTILFILLVDYCLQQLLALYTQPTVIQVWRDIAEQRELIAHHLSQPVATGTPFVPTSTNHYETDDVVQLVLGFSTQ